MNSDRVRFSLVVLMLIWVLSAALFPKNYQGDEDFSFISLFLGLGIAARFAYLLLFTKESSSLRSKYYLGSFLVSAIILTFSFVIPLYFEEFPYGWFYLCILLALLSPIFGHILYQRRNRRSEIERIEISENDSDDSDGQAQMAYEPEKQYTRTEEKLIDEDKVILEEMKQHGIITKSKSLVEAFRKIKVHADSDLSILITGPSGTGKELFARVIHELSRRKGEYVALNCASLPDSLIESLLYGYKEGSHNKADKDKDGLIKQADGGTLFLDEVADMSERLQQKLLRALEEKKILPLGADEQEDVDVRIVSATDQDISSLTSTGKFRPAMKSRLAGVEIRLSSLRERRQDIPLLCNHFFETLMEEAGWQSDFKPVEDDFKILSSLDLPGNVRDFKNLAERLFNNVKEGKNHTMTHFRKCVREELQELNEKVDYSSHSVCFNRLSKYHLLDTFSVYIEYDFNRKLTSEYLAIDDHTVDVEVNTSLLIFADEHGLKNVDGIFNDMLSDGIAISGKRDQFFELFKSRIEKCIKWEPKSSSKKPFKNPGDEIVTRLKSNISDLPTS